MASSYVWVGNGHVEMTLASRAACAMHSELDWRTVLLFPLLRLFFSQRSPLLSSGNTVPASVRELFKTP